MDTERNEAIKGRVWSDRVSESCSYNRPLSHYTSVLYLCSFVPEIMPGTLHGLDWLFAIGVLAFCVSIWSLGANDVANSYATSVSSKSLTLPQAGCLATITEFVGAIALGQKVTDTIRHGVFGFDSFTNSPGVLLMAMVMAEIGAWHVKRRQINLLIV